MVVEDIQMMEINEYLGVKGDTCVPGLGGPEAEVLLVQREVLPRGRVTGGFGESEVRFRRSVRRNAGFRGLEGEEYESEGCYGDCGKRDFV